MIKIIYPEIKPSIKREGEKELIYCIIRRRWMILTPEEWVRQNFLHYLISVHRYPASLIAVEKQLKLGDLTKRFDIVVYDKNTNPFMIIECKEMNVSLTDNVLMQALRYNASIQARFLIITNGSHCLGFEKRNEAFEEINEIPVF